MMWMLSIAAAMGCAETEIDEVARVDAPAIIVLGERHGQRDDLRNAARIVRGLARDGEVTVAVEAVPPRHQGVLDALTDREISVGRVREDTDWDTGWGHDFGAYKPLLRLRGVRFVAAGPDLISKPEDLEIPVPDTYDARFASVAAAHGVEDPATFSASMAFRDRRIAELAVAGWDGSGILVIVTGRGHVAEGFGVTWQLPRGISESPIHSALLAPPGESGSCGVDDRYLP